MGFFILIFAFKMLLFIYGNKKKLYIGKSILIISTKLLFAPTPWERGDFLFYLNHSRSSRYWFLYTFWPSCVHFTLWTARHRAFVKEKSVFYIFFNYFTVQKGINIQRFNDTLPPWCTFRNKIINVKMILCFRNLLPIKNPGKCWFVCSVIFPIKLTL